MKKKTKTNKPHSIGNIESFGKIIKIRFTNFKIIKITLDSHKFRKLRLRNSNQKNPTTGVSTGSKTAPIPCR